MPKHRLDLTWEGGKPQHSQSCDEHKHHPDPRNDDEFWSEFFLSQCHDTRDGVLKVVIKRDPLSKTRPFRVETFEFMPDEEISH